MRTLGFLLVPVLAACGSGSVTLPKDDGGGPSVDVPRDPGVSWDRDATVETQDLRFETGEETVEPPETTEASETGTDSGPFTACTTGDDCLLGLCVDGPDGGKVCAIGCTDTPCPGGWTCKSVVNTQGDVVFICLPLISRLCRPCAKTTDCRPPDVVSGDLCTDFGGAAGSFCTQDCSVVACPPGYVCKDVTVPEGGTYRQCLPESGECPCSKDSISAGYETPCFVKNDFGSCPGKRRCTEAGLTPCDAPTPARESCNLVDDDCDGVTDENADMDLGTCELTNAYGTCTAKNVCAHGAIQCDGVAPGPEKCDGKDNNCDGSTDGEGSAGCIVYAKDADKDGYGKSGDTKCLCEPTVPWTATQTGDCDDGDPDVGPGAPEVCGGGDEDCDGKTDEPGAKGCIQYYADQDGDGYGDPADGACLCTPDPDWPVLNKLDCNDHDAFVNPDITEICNGVDDDCDGTADEADAEGCVTFYKNADGDAYGDAASSLCLCKAAGVYTATLAGDCDDLDPQVAPGLPEKCDGKDNDCDGMGDVENAEGCQKYYVDGDLDGFGVDGDFRCLCAADGAYASTKPTDCDDGDATVHPGAKEACNGRDDDCDGVIDPVGSESCVVYYQDLDHDSWGVSAAQKCLCAAEGDYTATLFPDCDDGNPEINPERKERCNGGVDDNCDGEADGPGSEGCVSWYIDHDGDGWGFAGDSKCLCGPSGFYTVNKSGDCEDDNATVGPGSAEVCDGKDNDCDGQVDEENATGCLTFFADEDVDGHAAPTKSKCLCAAAGAFKYAFGDDCDDSDAKTYPGAQEKCDGKDNDCNGLTDEAGATGCTTWYYDGDGDGWGVLGATQCACSPKAPYTATQVTDCNDADPAVNPGRAEVCNGKDDNCDGVIDGEGSQGCTTYYIDSDGDGYGNSGESKCLCGPSGQYTRTQGGDCDDWDSSRNPGATEKCNGKDDDCDGSVDEAGASGCSTWYKDADGDGYGTSSSQCLCGASGSYTAKQSGDCDDTNASIRPGATEVCNGKDDDCDGTVDPENTGGCTTYYSDSDGDGYGTSAKKCLCAKSGAYTATKTGDCNDANAAIYPGHAEVCNNGKDDDCDGSTDEGCQPTYKIGINPDDGGGTGACGCNVCEDDLNLSMANHFKDWLNADTANTSGGGTWAVYMTRTSSGSNPSISSRVAYLNNNGVDRAVSISCNDYSGCASCCSGLAYGTETYKKNSSSSTTNDLASRVQSRVVAALGTSDRGVKTSTTYAILNTNMPHVYLFAGFLSDSGDSAKLKNDSNRNAVGKALMRAMQSHFGYAEFNP